MSGLRYLSVCSGIESATVAWHPLGWVPVAFSEIEPAPRAVLAHHWPTVKCHGDFTTIQGDEYGPFDLLVGGTPCQDFSIAGLRKGLAGERGNLSLEFLRLAQRTRPRWVVWENVPGVLSDDGGRSFGAILGGLAELGYGFAYRVLDAQYIRVDGFGRAVPQRRRRVFVVGYLGDWRRAAAVFFDRTSLSGDSAPRREARERVADCLTVGANQYSGFPGEPVEIARSLNAHPNRCDGESETFVVDTLTSNGDAHSGFRDEKGLVPVAFDLRRREGGSQFEGPHDTANIRAASWAVRRLTPVECCRLQGFPDDFFAGVLHRGKPLADGPIYKMLGNSKAVNVVRWIGRRIAMVEQASSMASEAAA